MKSILVTGYAGFIGYHVASRLLSEGWRVIGIDHFAGEGTRGLKELRVRQLKMHPRNDLLWEYRSDLGDRRELEDIFEQAEPRYVIHLAAQAGVRYALENPMAYLDSNWKAFLVLLEVCRHAKLNHLLFASSSSVYGLNEKLPFREVDAVDHPSSLYGASKRSNELMAHSYAHLFGIPSTGLRFFTVYGPWGRPDMAYYSFAERILNGQPLTLFQDGDLLRDFTYIDDIVEAILRLLNCPPASSVGSIDHPDRSSAPFVLYNVGRGQPTSVRSLVRQLELLLGKKAQLANTTRPNSDGLATHADMTTLSQSIDWEPRVSLEEGLERFIHWFLQHRDEIRITHETFEQRRMSLREVQPWM